MDRYLTFFVFHNNLISCKKKMCFFFPLLEQLDFYPTYIANMLAFMFKLWTPTLTKQSKQTKKSNISSINAKIQFAT